METSDHQSPTTTASGRAGRGGLLLSVAPLAAAVAVFGMIFGAAASVEMDASMAIGMSLLIFSGTLQFATLGLIASGAGVAAVVLTAIALNTRNVVLGGVLRPRVEGSPLRRALLAWFILDESFGLAVASGRRAALVLLISGVSFYVAWVLGTLLGVLGARLVALEGLATALFPVLFVGLAAITVRGRQSVVRVLIAAALVIVLSLLVPGVSAFVPIIAALVVAIPGAREP